MGVKARMLEQLRKLLQWTKGLSYPACLLGATAIVVIGASIQGMLLEIMTPHSYFVLLTAITICAIIFQNMTGLYAFIVGTAVYFYLILTPYYNGVVPRDEYVRLFIFSVSALLLIAVSELFRVLADALDDSDKRNAVLVERQHMLMREMRHRTRNYLQIVSAKVGLEADEAQHEETKASLERVAQRITSVAHIVSTLNEPGPKGLFDAREYLEGLVREVAASLTGGQSVTINCRAEAVGVDQDSAEVLGVIVNELLTNAVKYAFPGGRSGVVDVEFVQTPEGELHLTVSDNGVGGCSGQKTSITRPSGARTGVGLGLVSSLARLHGGRMEIRDASPGCHVEVFMKPTPE